MRKIFPDDSQTNALFNQDDNRATKQDIVDLSNQISAVDQKVDNTQNELDNLEAGLQESVNTNTISASSADIDNITSDTIEADNIEAATLNGDNATIGDIQSNNATISEVTAGSVDTGVVKAQVGTIESIQSDNATIDSADINSADIGTANITNANIQNYNTENITASGDLNISGNSTLKDVTADNIQVTKVDATEVDVEVIKSLEEKVENIVWNGSQTLANLEVFYASIPHFENGTYYVQISDNNVPILTLEILNSVDNYFVRWSQLNVGNLISIYKVGVGSAAVLVFTCENTTGHLLELKYATTSSTPNVSAPTITITEPEEYESEYYVIYKDGNKFYKNVDFANQGGTVGVLSVRETDDFDDTTLSYDYDTTANINAKTYKPDQSVNTDDEVEFASVSTIFLNVREFTTENFVSSSLRLPNTLDLSKFDDGAFIIVRNSSTASEPQPSTAYIKRTISGNVTLLPVAALNGVSTQTNIPLIWDATNHCLSEANNLVIPGNASIGGNVSVTGDLSVGGDFAVDSLEVTGAAKFDDKVNMEDDLTVAGDLYVKGTTHTTGVEDITATSDLITLRANNNTALSSGQVSGVVVNKYNGTDDLALVTDNDGTMRVGTGAGTDTTYNKVALKAADGKYYNYDDTDPEDIQYTLMNPQPSGTMTSWTNRQVITGYTLYAAATFTVIDKTSLIPLLGRDEESNLSDKQILQWDATGVKATGIPSPENGMFLKATVNPGADYHWSAITFAATGYSEVLYAFPASDNTTFGNLILKEGTKPSPIPSQATTVTHTYNDYFYDNSLDEVIAEDNGTYYRVVFNADGTCTVTDTVIASTSPAACTITSEKIDNIHGTAYQWAEAGGRGVTFKGTMAQYEVAKLIPFGQEGHIPSGSLVIITDEPDYVVGEDR